MDSSIGRNMWCVSEIEFFGTMLLAGCRGGWKTSLSWARIMRVMLASIVYYIWREPNSRVFTGISRRLSLVLTDITFAVLARMDILRSFGSTHTNLMLIWNWHISKDVLQPKIETWVFVFALYIFVYSFDIALMWRAWVFLHRCGLCSFFVQYFGKLKYLLVTQKKI